MEPKKPKRSTSKAKKDTKSFKKKFLLANSYKIYKNDILTQAKRYFETMDNRAIKREKSIIKPKASIIGNGVSSF